MWSEDFMKGFYGFQTLFMNPQALDTLNEEEKRGYHMAKSVAYGGGFISVQEVIELNDRLLPILQKRWGSHYCSSLGVKMPASVNICWFCSPKVKEICAHRERPKRSTDK